MYVHEIRVCEIRRPSHPKRLHDNVEFSLVGESVATRCDVNFSVKTTSRLLFDRDWVLLPLLCSIRRRFFFFCE